MVHEKIHLVLAMEKVLKQTFSEDFLNDYIISKGAGDTWHIDELIFLYRELAAQNNIDLPKGN